MVLSFMIAAIASTFSALCYAEFAAKVPKSGSAYAYSYITVGEFVAFVIGWNLTLEHVIGTASLARGYSGYLGSLFASSAPIIANSTGSSSLNITEHLIGHNHTSIEWLPDFMQGYVTHFDSLAFFLTMLVTGLLLLGVQVSSKFQITFASLNLSVALFIFICGLFRADFHNWNLSKDEIPASAGEGGFLPFGWTGVIAGAGTCFFAFVGFDGIAATAEEVKNPRKAIPNSILWTSGIIFITYCGMSTIQTLIWPYWDQKQAAPLPYIFERLDMSFAKWTVLVGVLAGLSTSFVGGFLPLPRILYAMARDGVIYRVLAIISKRFKVPIVATIVGGILIACLASMLEIDQLADMLSIGTLAAYSLVSISVLLLRYEYRKPTDAENPLPVTFGDQEKTAISRRDENIGACINGIVRIETDKKVSDKSAEQAGNGANKDRERRKKSNSSGPPSSGCSTGADSMSSLSSLSKLSSLTSNSKDASESFELSVPCSTSQRSLVSLFVDGTRGPNNTVRRPDEQTTHISRVVILLLVFSTTLLDFALVIYGPTLYQLDALAVAICSLLFIVTLVLGYLLNRLPIAEPSTNSFEVPLVPTIPLFSVIINTYLMLNLSGKSPSIFQLLPSKQSP